MEKIRIGNDIVILWDIFKIEDGAEVPYDLTGKSLALYLNNAVEKVKVNDFSVSENTVRMVFWGKEQKNSGIYSLTLVENEGLKGMYTVDECSAFELVSRSCLAGGSQESKVDIVTLKLRGTMMVGGGVVDDHLSDTSENAVMNRVVTEELNRKASAEDVPQRLSQLTDDVGLVTIKDVPTKVSDLENDADYTQKEYVDSQIAYLYDGKASKADLARKQDVLRAGTGIVINGNTIYCTLDTSVFKVVSYLPETGELQKIYLVPSDIRGEKNIYKEYAYIGNKWEVIGEFTSDIDLSEYAKKEDIHTPDWNAGEGEEGHIKNRTHFADFVEVDIPEDIESSEVELTIPHIVGVPILVHYRGYVTSKYLKIDAEDHELHVLSYGPAFKIRRGSGNNIFISGHNDENHRLYIATHFVELNEIFLPETIARKREITELSERVDELGQPIFKAVYGETKIEEIIAAYESGKVVHCDFNGLCYTLTRINNGEAFLTANIGVIAYRLQCTANGTWVPQTFILEQTSNKVTSISASSTDTQYPSAKAVYDAVSKKSEVSLEVLANGNLKVTINGVSKDFMPATPSGDPQHDAYVSAGAAYNATANDINILGLYGDTITHKSGCWLLNDVGDLTNEEMRNIYSQRLSANSVENLKAYWRTCNTRTTCSLCNIGQGTHDTYALFYACANLLTAQAGKAPRNTLNILTITGSGLVNFFYGSKKLEKALFIIDASSATSSSRFCDKCYALQYIRVKGLKMGISFADSAQLSNDSILYMINNEAATAAIAITLHASAYDRAMADSTITAALAAHPNVSLAKA